MRELNVNEVQEVHGGNPAVLFVAGFLARRYGEKAISFGSAAIIAWFAE